jgi:xylulokinase
MGVQLSSAGSFQWFKNALGGEETAREKAGAGNAYDLLTAAAAKVPAGSEGLLFLPYLSGERTPHPDPLARGVFFGLTLRHTKAHLAPSSKASPTAYATRSN